MKRQISARFEECRQTVLFRRRETGQLAAREAISAKLVMSLEYVHFAANSDACN